MARIDNLNHFLTDVADAIRNKKGTTANIPCANFDTEIASISGGGEGDGFTTPKFESFSVTPIDSVHVTDEFAGTSATDETLSNCPSLSDFYTDFYDKFLQTGSYSVTKRSLGKDQSDTYDIYEYDFKPANWSKTILLSSGMNGYEVGALFGLAYFMENVVEHYSGNALLTFLHNNVRIKVIPFSNPWGYAQSPKKYLNSRGVNINRNFDFDGEWARYNPGTNPNNAKGDAPFSEAETRILRRWAEENYGAAFWIDCHTGLITQNKDLYSSSLTTSPFYSKVLAAHTKLESWTKSFYGVSSVHTNYLYDSDGALKQRWYEGTFGIPMLVVEQCSLVTQLGILLNGSKESFINYTGVLSGYVGEFLLDEGTHYSGITLMQKSIANKKYLRPESSDPTPPEPTNVIHIKQGSLSSSDGTPTENLTRAYTEEYLPISSDDFTIIKPVGDWWFGGRCYTDAEVFTVPFSESATSTTVAYKNSAEHSTSWGITDEVALKRGSSVRTSTKCRLIFRHSDGSANVNISDLVGSTVTVSGVEYTIAI